MNKRYFFLFFSSELSLYRRIVTVCKTVILLSYATIKLIRNSFSYISIHVFQKPTPIPPTQRCHQTIHFLNDWSPLDCYTPIPTDHFIHYVQHAQQKYITLF